MPRIIRQALGERIRRDPELQRLLREFALATGMTVVFAGPLGHRDDVPNPESAPLCARLRQDQSGCRMCSVLQQTLLEASSLQPVTRRCDAGLTECAVPLRAAGQTLGYLVISGFASEPVGTAQVNRARHLLARAGVHLSEVELEDLLRRSPVVAPDRQTALINILRLAAEHLTAKITERLVEPDVQLPPLIEQACRIVRSECAQPVSIPDIARRLGSSEGHLSRTFHRATGLRLVEYIARSRAERAWALLRETDRSITDVAFACGFQSLSQFNRVFRAQFGLPPTEARVQARGSRSKPGEPGVATSVSLEAKT